MRRPDFEQKIEGSAGVSHGHGVRKRTIGNQIMKPGESWNLWGLMEHWKKLGFSLSKVGASHRVSSSDLCF